MSPIDSTSGSDASRTSAFPAPTQRGGSLRGPAPIQQVVSWIGPCIASGLTKTVVHFFPAARGVASPYAVSCRLTLFGDGTERRSVVLEGARLNQPDGLFVEEAFPELLAMAGAGAGTAGLELELFTDQPRVDVGPSRCVFEYHSGLNVVRFNPVCVSLPRSEQLGAACFDNQISSSLVIVNRSKMSVLPNFSMEFRGQVVKVATEAVAGQSVAEFPLRWDGESGEHVRSEQFQWGTGVAATLRSDEPLTGSCGAILMYRDVQTKQPLSAVPL
jgi:hypothetical protein